MIEFNCLNCFAALKALETYAGKGATCKNCGTRVMIPTTNENKAHEPVLPNDSKPAKVAPNNHASLGHNIDEQVGTRTSPASALGDAVRLRIRERGRQQIHAYGCNAYFEVVDTPPGIDRVKIFTLNDQQIVLGIASIFRVNGLTKGMLFEAMFNFTVAGQIASWQVQGQTSFSNSCFTCLVPAMSRKELSYVSEPNPFFDPPITVLGRSQGPTKAKEQLAGGSHWQFKKPLLSPSRMP